MSIASALFIVGLAYYIGLFAEAVIGGRARERIKQESNRQWIAGYGRSKFPRDRYGRALDGR
jgi:hypothetical protein